MPSKKVVYDPKLIQVSKLPISGSRVERRGNEYTVVSPRYYQVVDRNFGTSEPFIIEVADSNENQDDDSDVEPGVVVQLMLAPSRLPKRVAAVSQLTSKFNHPKARSRRKGAYAAVTFRRPLVWGGLKKVGVQSFGTLPSWFTTPLHGNFSGLRGMLTDKQYIILGSKNQVPMNLDFVLTVYFPVWDESKFVAYYMINRVFAAYQKYVFVSTEQRTEALNIFSTFPKSLQSRIRRLRKSEMTRILLATKPSAEVELPEDITQMISKSGVSVPKFRKYLHYKLLTEAPW